MPSAVYVLIALGLMVGMMAALPILAHAFAEYLKAKAHQTPIQRRPDNLEERLERIEKAVAALAETRGTALDHTMSVERNLELLQSRLAHIEQKIEAENQQQVRG